MNITYDHTVFPEWKGFMLKLVADVESIYNSEASAEEKDSRIANILENL